MRNASSLIVELSFLHYSFVQSDIAEGIVAWVNHNINERCTSVVTERDDKNMAIGKNRICHLNG